MDILIIIQTAADAFLNSYFFAAVKIFFGIYTIVLIVDIILILSFRDIRKELRQGSYGTGLVPSVSKSTMHKQWSAIEDRLKSGNISEYKVAILEADNIVEGILKDIGYNSGADMAQKIEQLGMMQPEDAAMLDEAHKIRNRIVFEQDFHPDLDQTRKILENYKNYLKKFDYFQ
jgi:uncharacterized protein YutE (UPF0331/DUF86 family)